MAVLFKILASALLVAVLAQSAFGAPKDATGTRRSSGTPWRDSEGFSSSNSVTDPKSEVELVDPVPSETPPTLTSTSTSSDRSECPGAYDGPSRTTILLLETRADQLQDEFKKPRSAVVEALGEDTIRRLQTEFAVASVGFQGIVPIADRLAAEGDLPCADRTRMLKLYTERNARLTKKVADAYGVLASKVREAIAKKDKDADSTRLQIAADDYDSLRASYLQAYERAERQRVEAAKLTIDADEPSQTTGVLTSNEQPFRISQAA